MSDISASVTDTSVKHLLSEYWYHIITYSMPDMGQSEKEKQKVQDLDTTHHRWIVLSCTAHLSLTSPV